MNLLPEKVTNRPGGGDEIVIPPKPKANLCITQKQIYLRDALAAIQHIEARSPKMKTQPTIAEKIVDALPSDMTFMADFFKHDAYFWLSKILEAAYATNAIQHALIINSIIIRYSDEIFARRDPTFTTELRTTLISTFTDLVTKIGGYLKTQSKEARVYTTAEISAVFETGDMVYDQQATGDVPVADDASLGFLGQFTTALSSLLKYMKAQGVFSDLIRLMAIGMLGSFTFLYGDRNQFNLASIEGLVKTAMRACTEGTLGCLGRVVMSLFGIFRDYVTGHPNEELSEFIRQNTQQEAMRTSTVELEIKRRNWGVLSVAQQGEAVEEWLMFELYCDATLGRGKGWASGKRILAHDLKLLNVFQAAYTTLKIHFTNVNMGALRATPWCIALIGPSSIGKSTILDMLMDLLLRSDGHTNINELVYNLLGESEFFDGCTNGKKGFILDDMGNKLPQLTASRGGDPQLACLVRLLNNVPYFPAMACVEDKGMVCAKPTVVAISANNKSLGIEHSYCSPAIVYRRVERFADVRVNPEFADAGGALDSQKLIAFTRKNPGLVANVWTFTLTIKKAAIDAEGNLCTRDTQLAPMNTSAFFQWCLLQYKEHHKTQEAVLTQANTPYNWEHTINHGGAIDDPAIIDYDDVGDGLMGLDIVSSVLTSYKPGLPEVKPATMKFGNPGRDTMRRYHGIRDLFQQQSGEDTPFKEPDLGAGFDDSGSWWNSMITPLALLVAATSTWYARSSLLSAWDGLVEARDTIAFLWNYFTVGAPRVRAVLDWVEAGLALVKRVAIAIAPFVGVVAVLAVAAYISRKARPAVDDNAYDEQGGTITKRKSPEPEGTVRMKDIALMPSDPVTVNQYTEEAGVKTIKYRMIVADGFAKKGALKDPNMTTGIVGIDNFYQADPSGKINEDAPVNRGWIPLDNDKRKSYLDSQPKWKEKPGVVPHTMLSNASKSALGFDVVRAVANNMADIVFTSAPINDAGSIGELLGVRLPSRTTYAARGMFYGKNEFTTSAHYMPWLNTDRKDDPKWKTGWTMTVKGVGDKGSDVIMTDVEIRAGNVIKIVNKDLIKVRVPKARMHSNLVKYMPKRLVPEDATQHQWVTTSATELGRHAALNAFEYLPKNLPVAFLGRTGVSPTGYVTDTSFNKAGDDESGAWNLILSRVYIPYETFPGDCGSPYILHESGNYRAVVGLHTGAIRACSTIKVVTPICQEDFTENYFNSITPAAFAPTDVITAPELMTLQDATEDVIRHYGGGVQDVLARPYTMKFPDGPQKTDGIHVQYYPETEESPWTRRTEGWIKDALGVEVNQDTFLGMDKRTDAITGNLKSEYYFAPTLDLLAEEGITSNKVPMNLNRSDRNFAAAVNMSAMMSHAKYDPVLQEEVYEATNCFLKSVLAYDEDRKITQHLTEIPMDLAINGSRAADGSPEFRTLNSVNMSTAAGLPYSEIMSGNKNPWFITDEDGIKSMGEDLEKGFVELRQLMTHPPNGREVKVVFKVAVKDEVLAQAKISAGEVRFILVCPVNATILTRKMMLCLCRAMANNPFVFGACVGVDSTSAQWAQLFSFLTEHGQLTWDGDYSKFDKKLILEITNGIRHFIVSLLIRSGNYSAESLRLCENLLKALLSPIVDIFGLLYWFKSLNSSGNPLTTQFNCIANMIFIWLAFLRRVKRNTGTNFDLNRAYELFMAIIRALTYGDDNVLSIDNQCGDIFNCRIMAEELTGIIQYTNAQKSTECTEFTDYAAIMFLGRKWTTNGCPLEEKRIFKMMTTYRKHHGLDYSQVIGPIYRSVLLEAYFHGRPYFDALHAKIVRVFSKHFDMPASMVVDHFLSHGEGPLTYEFFDEWYLAKAQTEALEDPRFEDAKRTVGAADAIAWYRAAAATCTQ